MPAYVAVIVAIVVGGVLLVAMVKVWTVAPAGTTTAGGAETFGALLASAISAPPSGAGVGNVTVPVTGRPPGIEPGSIVIAS